ncbi:Vegetative incompatibility protein HET-E-1 [Diplonema papillatum]|nr:Vegetative incompatibility protein HET-E-1 [Diplonema papillatum]
MGCAASSRRASVVFTKLEKPYEDHLDGETASAGSADSPPSSATDMHPQNNPFGTFEHRKSNLPHLNDEPMMAEDFLFSDFTVLHDDIKKIQGQAKRGRAPGRFAPSVKGARKDDNNTFMFSDFAVSVVSDLDEEIVAAHLAKKRADGEKLRKAEEAALFQFGDFKVTQADDALFKRAGGQSRRAIKAFSIYNLLGHSTRVKTISMMSTDASYVSCSNMDTDVGMYDVTNGREIVSFVGHSSTVSGASISRSTKLVATTSTDLNMILWDAVTGKQIFIFEHAKIVVCSCFSSEAKYLISGSQDKTCRVWDTRKGKLIRTYSGHGGVIICIAYSPVADHAASGGSEKTLKVWNCTTGVDLHTLQGHTGIILSCQYSGDGQRLISCDEATIRIWNLQSGVVINRFSIDTITPAAPIGAPRRLTWTLATYCSGRGQYLIAACSDRTVRIFQATTGREVLYVYCRSVVYCLSCGGRNKIVFGDSFGNVYVLSLT